MKNRYYFFLILSFPFFVAAQSETQSIDTLSLLDSENESRLQLLLDTENKKAKEILQYAAQRTNTEFGVKSLGDFSSDRFEVDHNYFFKYVVTNVRSSACLFYKANILQDWDLLLNPEYLAAPYDCNILDYDVSKDSRFLAFTYAKEGEQFLLAQAIMLGNRVMQKDLLFGVASPELTWFRNGFFYHRITSGVDGLERSIWYHELGKEQENDKKIFSGNKENNGKIGVIIPRDEKRVIFYDLGKT